MHYVISQLENVMPANYCKQRSGEKTRMMDGLDKMSRRYCKNYIKSQNYLNVLDIPVYKSYITLTNDLHH